MPTAMVVDDSKAIRMILTRSLNKVGYEVCTAAHGKEALDILEQQGPELACFLVDWVMPEMNGIEFLERVRRMPSYAGVPLMMITTETDTTQIIRALEAGADEYVMKPFTDEIIADKLRLLGVLE